MVKDVHLGAHGIGEIGITGAAAADVSDFNAIKLLKFA